jgi:phage terminase Nu1 subunit (DNA packaging protein)
LRLISARADEQELELAQKRAELVSIADVEKEMTDLVATTKARILTVPARLAPDLLGEESRVMVQAKLEKALKEALAHLAETPTAAPAAAC